MDGFYAFSARALRGGEVSFERFRGQAALVVNTASRCGFTPQYAGLEALHRTYGDRGLAVLGFPCDQFGGQEPGDADEIANGCLVNYGVSFPMFEKIEVKGPGAHPLFAFLTRELPGVFGRPVRWNFTKFLIARDGRPLRRFAPFAKPEKLEGPIRAALDARAG